MISDYYVNLHFNQAIAQRTGYAFKIGDKGCTFHFHCEDLDPSGMYPHIVFNHPNNTCVEGVPTGSGRDYAYTIQGNEFAVIGKTVVDLKFYDALDATQRISTASFIIEILPDTYTDFEEASSSYADSLERAREEIDAAIIELQGAEHDLEEAETDLGNMSDQFADTLQDYIDAFGNTGPINPRGAYDDEEEYVPRDAVAYTAGGKTLTYINKQACTGIAPTDPDEGAAHWQIMIDVSVGGSFSALSDVNVDPQTLADGQVPVYDATGEVWENKTILEDSLTSTATDKALTAAKGKELQDNKQDKNLETALTIDGTVQSTVEGALGGLNGYVDDVDSDVSTLGTNVAKISDTLPNNAGAHNRYRGKALTIDADFWAHISDGTFEDQFVGDTITINDRTYILAHANYWLHTGDTACETNHWVVISPNMGNAKMNSDNSTAGGYLGSGLRSGTNHDSTPNTVFANAIATIKSDFGASHILSHREYLDDAITSNYPSSGIWADSEAELMTQIQVLGNKYFDPGTNLGQTFPSIFSVNKTQFALFNQSPELITTGSGWWLRDVSSSVFFSVIDGNGIVNIRGASNERGIRLAFGIKA